MGAGGRAPHADEQPRPRGGRATRRPRGVRRQRPGRPVVGGVPRDRGDAARPRERRDAARPVGQARRGVPDARVGAPGAHRQLAPRARLGHWRGVPPPRSGRAHDVRADDGRVVDLHRHPRDPARHLRVLRRHRRPPLRRDAGRHDHVDRWSRRHGRRPAVGRDDERRRGAVRRRRPDAHRAPLGDPVPRRGCGLGGGRPCARRGGAGRAAAALDRGRRQRGRSLRGVARGRLRARHRHRPDAGARPVGVRPRGVVRGRRCGASHPRRRRLHRASPGVDGPALRGDGRVPRPGRRGVRLRQQPPRRGEARRLRPGLRLSRVRARVHPPAVLRGQGPVPVGGPVG